MLKEISFLYYLRSKKTELGFIAIVSLVFWLLFYAHGIRRELIGYGMLVAMVFYFLWNLVLYSEYKRVYESLRVFLDSDDLSYSGKLDGQIENLLLNKVSMYKKNKSEIISKDKENLNKMNDFYTLWAHQIKTPIAAASLIIEDEGSLEDIKLEIMKIENYVDVLLAYFRHHSVSTDYVFRELCLDEVIRSALRKFSTLFINKKLSLKYTPTNAKIISDEKWLGFIIEQILSNALKYTNKGSITITMEGDTLKIKDTGIGIQESDLPRIFELGFTGYNGRIYTKSTGIGLNLVKSISERLNIDVKINSKVDEYTELCLKFQNSLTKM